MDNLSSQNSHAGIVWGGGPVKGNKLGAIGLLVNQWKKGSRKVAYLGQKMPIMLKVGSNWSWSQAASNNGIQESKFAFSGALMVAWKYG